MDSPELGFVALRDSAIMPGAETCRTEAFCFQSNKLETDIFEGIDPLTSEAKASGARLSNGLPACEGVFAVGDGRQRGWFWLSNRVIDVHGPDLGPFGIAAYVALVRHADAEGKCFPSLATLAKETGMGRTKLIEALAKIQKLGLMTITHRQEERRGQVANVYTLTNPAPKESTTPVRHTDGGAFATRTGPVRHTDTKEYPQEGLTTPPNGGGDVPSHGSAPGELADRLEGITGLSFDPDPAATALVDSLANEDKPKAKRVDVWQPFKETWRRSLRLADTKSTWQYAQKSVAVAKANDVSPADAPAVWARFEKWARTAGEWRFVTRQTADERFAKWLGDHHVNASASNGHDPRFWFQPHPGAWSLRNPQAVAASMGDGFNPHDPATWPADMRAVYASRIYATDDGREAFA